MHVYTCMYVYIFTNMLYARFGTSGKSSAYSRVGSCKALITACYVAGFGEEDLRTGIFPKGSLDPPKDGSLDPQVSTFREPKQSIRTGRVG